MPHSLPRWRQLINWVRPTLAPESRRPAQAAGGGVVQRVARNFKGRDLAVGDIHGSFDSLQRALDRIGFDPAVDRLFAVGDLVDRGPQSHQVLDWLAQPWFFSVCGNHDYMIWRSQTGLAFPLVDSQRLGNAWFAALADDQRAAIGQGLQALPLAIEVATAAGWVGLVHASCPGNDWNALHDLDLRQLDDLRSEAGQCMWSTQRAVTGDTRRVRNIRAVIHGHITVGSHMVLGNVHFIDTGGWRAEGHFTLLDLASLRPARQDRRASVLPT
jgi:serine/threonine protein phosphatase 1